MGFRDSSACGRGGMKSNFTDEGRRGNLSTIGGYAAGAVSRTLRIGTDWNQGLGAFSSKQQTTDSSLPEPYGIGTTDRPLSTSTCVYVLTR